MIGEQGQGLVFILSQPRAGSTLLQRMLGAHPAVYTTQEPAIALFPLYGLRTKEYQAEFQAATAQFFQSAFLDSLPGGEEVYVEGLRRMLTHLYNTALSNGTGRYFLDKTPRYYFIIPELLRVFPEARYVLLLRNPLAVLTSILTTWVRGDWLGLGNARSDLIEAPPRLLAGCELLDTRAIEVHYETLVAQPEEEIRRICQHLNLDYSPDMISYSQGDLPRWQHADQKSIYRFSRPEPSLAHRWIGELAHPQIWRLAHDYLQHLGPQMIASMQYDYAVLERIIADAAPNPLVRQLTFSFAWLARRPPPQRSFWEHRRVWFVKRFFLPYSPQQESPQQ